MEYEPNINKSYSPAGALETNLRARRQAKQYDAIEAAWLVETGLGGARKEGWGATLFDRIAKQFFGWAAAARPKNSSQNLPRPLHYRKNGDNGGESRPRRALIWTPEGFPWAGRGLHPEADGRTRQVFFRVLRVLSS